jgi:hypothetical protein
LQVSQKSGRRQIIRRLDLDAAALAWPDTYLAIIDTHSPVVAPSST